MVPLGINLAMIFNLMTEVGHEASEDRAPFFFFIGRTGPRLSRERGLWFSPKAGERLFPLRKSFMLYLRHDINQVV